MRVINRLKICDKFKINNFATHLQFKNFKNFENFIKFPYSPLAISVFPKSFHLSNSTYLSFFHTHKSHLKINLMLIISPLKVVQLRFITSRLKFEIVFRRFLLIENENSILAFLLTLISSSISAIFALSSLMISMYSFLISSTWISCLSFH